MYKVMTECCMGASEDCWALDGEPLRFNSIAEAWHAIIEHVKDLDEASNLGYMSSAFDYDDYTIERDQ